MAVYYYEGCPIVAPLRIESNEPLFVSDNVNLKQIRTSQGVQRWELTFGIITKDNEASLLIADTSKKLSGSFMEMPQLNEVLRKLTCPSGTNTNTVGAVGDNSISIDPQTAGTVLPKGTFIQFANSGHNKVYMVTQDLIHDGVNPQTLHFYPNLVQSVPDTAFVRHPNSTNEVTFYYYKEYNDIQGITYEDGILVEITGMKIIEAI